MGTHISLNLLCKKYVGGKESNNFSARSVLDSVTEIDDWSDKEAYFDNWFPS